MLNWRKPLLVPALQAIRPVTAHELALLRRLDRAPAAEVARVHEERLERLLRHAHDTTDYYRDVLSTCGVVRGGKVDLGRFERIPILTREIIREQGARLRARTLPPGRKAFANRTGGSTGEPIQYWQDSHYWDINVATKLYHFEMLGKALGEPELKVWGSDRDIVIETGTLKRRSENFLYHRRIMACGKLDEAEVEGIVAELNRFRPKTLWGYVDGLYTIAQHVNRTGCRIHRPAAVITAGGTLLPPMREAIGRAFRTPVVNLYGSREMGDMACECPEMAGLHLSCNSHRVEVLDEAGRSVVDEDGDLIVTSLHNHAMPFIRYRIGDRGCLSSVPCPCGRPHQLLKSVSGRGMEAFLRRDGAVISPIYLITAVGGLVEPTLVRRVQFVQKDHERVVVKLVKAEGADPAALERHCERIRAKLRTVMGATCEVRFEQVGDIPRTASGKYLYTVSEVAAGRPGLARFSA